MIDILQITNLIVSGLTFLYLIAEDVTLKALRLSALLISFFATLFLFGENSWVVVVLLSVPFFTLLTPNKNAHNIRDL